MTPDLFPAPIPALSLDDLNTTVNHEPRIKALRLAEMLGFSEPRNIHALVTRNKAALERFGGFCCTVQQNPSKLGGRPKITYWLNKKQALYLCTKSDSPNATEVTIRMVEVFDAFTAGHLPASKSVEKHEPPRTTQVRAHTRRAPACALPAAPPAPSSTPSIVAMARAMAAWAERDRDMKSHMEYILHLLSQPLLPADGPGPNAGRGPSNPCAALPAVRPGV